MQTLPLLLAANAASAAVLAAVVTALAWAVRRPAFANRAWLVVLLKLLAPPLVAVPVAVSWAAAPEATERASAVSDEPRGSPPRSDEAPAEAISFTAGINPAARSDEPAAFEPDPAEPVPVVEPAPVRAVPSEAVPALPAAEPVQPGVSVLPLLTVAWLLGVVGWWALVAYRLARFRRLLRAAEPAPAEVVDLARRAAAQVRLRRLPRILLVAADVSPMVWATIGRPRVLLPKRLWAALDPDQREAVLAHELAHLARRDHWVRRLELVVLGLYWWFPVAWLAVRQLRRAEEACCDAWAVRAVPGRAAAYAEALVEAVAFVSRPGWVPLASGGAARVSQLKRRLIMILQNPAPPRLRWPAGLAVAALAAAVLPWAPTLAEDPPKPVNPPPPAGVDVQPVVPAGGQPAANPPAQTPLPGPVPRSAYPGTPPPPPSHITAEDIERLRDEVELLAVQRETKLTLLRVAERALKHAEVNMARMEQLAKQAAVSDSTVAQARSEYESALAQLEVRKAELKEHEVRLGQAQRRWNRLSAPRAQPGQPTVTVPAKPGAAGDPLTLHVDVGEVAPRATVTRTVQFENWAKRPLTAKLVEVRRASSGTDIEVQLPAGAVEPGKPVTVTLTVKAGDKPGDIQGYAVLADPNLPGQLAVLKVTGRVAGPGGRPKPTAGTTPAVQPPATARDRLKALDQEAAQLAKQREDLHAKLQAIEAQMRDLQALEENLRDRTKKLEDTRAELLKLLKDAESRRPGP